MDKAKLQARVDEIQWCHSINLGDGIVTPGLSKTKPLSDRELPDLSGKSVLDIGAWDGLNSFLAEQKGAARVVALDHYAWGVDMARRNVYWDECRKNKRFPDYRFDETLFWDASLPGKAGFDLAKEVLGSKVESKVGDFMKLTAEEVGVFDVVFFLGVLYHLRDPLGALEKVRSFTKEVAVIETSAVVVPGHEGESLIRYYPADELEGDFGNYFGPSEEALASMLKSVGFSRTMTIVGPAKVKTSIFRKSATQIYRLLVHAFV
jgi:tRNA (mo5U34)-methyltransferase